MFRKLLALCVAKGMVKGRRQAVDNAFTKANVSLESLIEKEIADDVTAYADELNNSEYKIAARKKKQVEQYHQWKQRQSKDMLGMSIKRVKRATAANLSNQNIWAITPTIPPQTLMPAYPQNSENQEIWTFWNSYPYTTHHVITGVMADFADKRDSQ